MLIVDSAHVSEMLEWMDRRLTIGIYHYYQWFNIFYVNDTNAIC